jgi:hypothetical protein
MPPHLRSTVAVLAALLLVLVGAPVAAGAQRVDARVLLRDLEVEREQRSGYQRTLFPHWDATGDGCNVRARVLIDEARVKPRITGRCTLVGGRWLSAFDNRTVTAARRLDVDHLVPLAEAWRSGAHGWDGATRRAFANDLDYPLTLIAVTASANRRKGDKDPARWLPTFDAYRCTYVASWVAVKWRWRLSVDRTEHVALRAGLAGCGRKARVPRPPRATIVLGDAAPPTGEAAGEGTDPRFATCREAIAAGYGPYIKGQHPEYDWYRDRDGDGIVCER